ncbi:MAG TPA: helix-turn-helix domain-containing protein, partial [Propionibacteriaceae bacterium]
AKSRRAAHNARSMSHVRHDSATLLPDEPESAPNQKRIKIAKAAEILGVDVRTVYRWRKRPDAKPNSGHDST